MVTIHSDDTKDDSYRTFDIGCAAALMAAGIIMKEMDRTDPRRAEFIFARTLKVEKLASDYFNDKLVVSARKLFDSMKTLKSRLYGNI